MSATEQPGQVDSDVDPGDARWRDVGAYIREQRRVTQLSLRRLSEMAGISNPYLSQIERGMRRPSAEILHQIARALQISSETLYIQAGLLEDRWSDRPVDVPGEIGRDPQLGDEQKRLLLRMYWTYRNENRQE
jgi:transcriptional regulator with XRE-family HTH domain